MNPLSPKAAIASKYTWFNTGAGERLHYIPEAAEMADMKWWDDAVENGGREGTGACGVRTMFFGPGIFSRMGAPRCKKCCRAIGLPEGLGTPFNDSTLTAQLAEGPKRSAGKKS